MNRPESAPLLMRTLFNGWEPRDSINRAGRMTLQTNVYWFTKDIDNQVVSSVTLYIVDLLSRRLAVIEEVVTLPDYRNRGYATALIQQAIQFAVTKNVDCVELCVRNDDMHTKLFYERLGFNDRHQTVMRLLCDVK